MELTSGQLLELYDQDLYLDTYEKARPFWRQEVLDQLQPQDIVHAGRISRRVGGHRLCRWLFRRARLMAPDDPAVMHFTFNCGIDRRNLLQQLEIFEQTPLLATDDTDMNAGWLADNACWLAYVRDFDQAQRRIEQAREYSSHARWVSICEGWLRIHMDQWDEAREIAEELMASRPSMPAGVAIYSHVMSKVREHQQAADTLIPVATGCQSYEVVSITVNLLLGIAERNPSRRAELASQAEQLLARMEHLMPLQDRETQRLLAYHQMDLALLKNDRSALEQYSSQVQSRFFKRVRENLQKTPEGKQILLPCKPVHQKHNTCLPSSIATVVSAFGVELDDDALARELTYDGTATWRAVNWLEQHQMACRTFVVTPELAEKLITAGIPFVLCNNYDAGSHATAAIGLDKASGLLIIHDPGSYRWVQVFLENVADEERPIGPEGIAIVPADQADRLEIVAYQSHIPAQAAVDFWEARETQSPQAACSVVSDYVELLPDHPAVKRLGALARVEQGNLAEAIEIQEQLLGQWPVNIVLRNDLLGSLRATRNSARVRDALGELVERGRLPSVDLRKPWRRPPAVYLTQYADYFGQSVDSSHRASILLHRAIRQHPTLAMAYHVLGDLRVRQGRHDEALLAYRVAACLEYENDHFARAYCDTLRRVGREQEGLDFLLHRVRELGERLKGGHPWVAYTDALEGYGRCEEAIEVMGQALQNRPDDPVLLSFAVSFSSRMGRWDEARDALEILGKTPDRARYLQAAVLFYVGQGLWDEAHTLGRQWIDECPNSPFAREMLLSISLNLHGRSAQLDLVRSLMEQRADDESVEDLYIDVLKSDNRDEEVSGLLRKRLDRNPLDSWAWRELGYSLLREHGLQTVEQRKKTMVELEEISERIGELDPYSNATWWFRGNLLDATGNHAEAVEAFMQGIALEPSEEYGYRRVWDLGDHLDREQLLEISRQLEQRLLNTIGPLHHARTMAFRLAQSFGVKAAESAVQRWREQLPEDPELLEAHADLLLFYGQGRSDATRVVELLEPAVTRYPNHFDVAFSLADAYSVLMDTQREVQVWQDLLRRDPRSGRARDFLARMHLRENEGDQAIAIMQEGLQRTPMEQGAWLDFMGIYQDLGDHQAALDLLQRGIEKMPRNIALRRNAINVALTLDQDELAVDLARKGVEIFPDGAYCWFLLAQTLQRCRINNDLQEVEEALKTALNCNAALFEAADMLSDLQARSGRYALARETIGNMLELGNDPAPVKAQLACIQQIEGDTPGAIRQMGDVVRRWPAYSWGWGELMRWIEQEESWDLAREYLDDPVPCIQQDPDSSARRLSILEQAGASTEDLDPQWDQLLHDFPQNEVTYTRRFDVLCRQERLDEARKVIEAIYPVRSLSEFVVARRLHLAIHQKRNDEIQEYLPRLWTLPNEHGYWPLDRTWELVKESPLVGQTVQLGVDLLLSGRKLHGRAIEHIVGSIKLMARRGTLWQRCKSLLKLQPPHHILVLQTLLDKLHESNWDGGLGRAAILDYFNENGYRPLVLDYWRANKDTCRQLTPLWMCIAHVLLDIPDPELTALRDWMDDWREHQGIEMWAVSNYTYALNREDDPSRMPLLVRTARDALEHLPQDHTAMFMAALLCQTTLKLKHIEEFVADVQRYEYLLDDDLTDQYLGDIPTNYPKAFVLLGQLRTRDFQDTEDLEKWLGETYEDLSGKLPAWFRSAWDLAETDRKKQFKQ